MSTNMSAQLKPYLFIFSKRDRMSVAILQQIVHFPAREEIKLICIEPIHLWFRNFAALAKVVKSVPTMFIMSEQKFISGFEIMNWIKDKTTELGGPIGAPTADELEGVSESEFGKGSIVSDIYSYLKEDDDNLQKTDAGMSIMHSYASIAAAYSGPPSKDVPVPAGMGGAKPNPFSTTSAGRTAKEREFDKEMQRKMAERDRDVPGPPRRIGS